MLSDQQYDGAYSVVLCIFSVHEHNGDPRSSEGYLDIGVAASWLWQLLCKIKLNQLIALPIVGFAGSMVNTVTVMGSIYLLFAQQYADAREVGITAVWGLIMGTITASGVPEAIAASLLVLALGKVLLNVFKRMDAQ